MSDESPPKIWTIGHSTRELDDFLALLHENAIGCLVDVRRFPGSRKYPHFNADQLSSSLNEHGIEYLVEPHLGGRRRPDPNSPNTVWRNRSFRAYADYMDTPQFAEAVAQLMEQSSVKPTAIMCSEAVWWSCHRSMISDFLKVAGVTVEHIMGPGKVGEHPFTSAAKVVDGKLLYGAAK